MYFRAIAGCVAGLCAGVVSGIMFLLMPVPESEGLTYSVLGVMSRVVGSNDTSVGWSYHLFNSALVGVFFAIVLGRVTTTFSAAVLLGWLSGLACWAMTNLVLLPRMTEEYLGIVKSISTPFGLGTLIGYSVLGIILGAVYLWVYNPIRAYESTGRDEASGGSYLPEDQSIARGPGGL